MCMIAVFFGGRSCEHDISIITGLQTLSACKRPCVGVYIGTDGVWRTSNEFDSVNAVRNGRFKGRVVHIRPGENYLYCGNKRLCKIDVAVLCMHGILGEDGALQGMLEMCAIPYTGSGVEASAIGMNKLLSKRVFERAGLPVVPYALLRHDDYTKDAHGSVKPIIEQIGFPLIVKPNNLGSSIGITIANNINELYKSVRIAFEWSETVIIEKALKNFTEVNCAVLGDGYNEVIVSDTEQPVGWKEFLTFKDKYSGDVKSNKHKIPAGIPEERNDEVKSLAVKVFNAVGCSGVARIDFMLTENEIFVNEINTIPGSLSSPLFRKRMDFSELIERLIAYAELKKARFDRLKRVYTPIEPIIGK